MVERIGKLGRTHATNLVQSVFMGFLRVQRTLSICMSLLKGIAAYAPRKILKIRYNELKIEFGNNFDWNVTLVLQATCTMIYIIYMT